MHVTMNGRLCHVAYKPVPGTSWSLALVCPDNDILARYHHLTNIILILIVIGMLLIVFMSYKVVGRAVRPLGNLLGMLERIAAGHYDEAIPYTDREDAIGQLQNSFATMQESLNEHVGSIRRTVEQTKERNEELVRATQLAEVAVRQKTAFIQDVSHQIRTPLNIISGFAQVLSASIESIPDEDVEDITARMKQSAGDISRLTHELSEAAKPTNTI